MMSGDDNVIELFKREEEEIEHTVTGDVVCIGCKHEWVGVTPVGQFDGFECPKCGLFKGVFMGLCGASRETWQCPCGCDVFRLTKEWFVCIQCGTPQEFKD